MSALIAGHALLSISLVAQPIAPSTLTKLREICSVERTLHGRLRRRAERTLSDPRHGLEPGGWLVATWHRRPPRDARADLGRGWRLEVGGWRLDRLVGWLGSSHGLRCEAGRAKRSSNEFLQPRCPQRWRRRGVERRVPGGPVAGASRRRRRWIRPTRRPGAGACARRCSGTELEVPCSNSFFFN